MRHPASRVRGPGLKPSSALARNVMFVSDGEVTHAPLRSSRRTDHPPRMSRCLHRLLPDLYGDALYPLPESRRRPRTARPYPRDGGLCCDMRDCSRFHVARIAAPPPDLRRLRYRLPRMRTELSPTPRHGGVRGIMRALRGVLPCHGRAKRLTRPCTFGSAATGSSLHPRS